VEGCSLLIVAPRLANIKRGRNLRQCVRSANQAAGQWLSISGWMVTLVNEPAGAAALPPPARSARELVGRASAEGSSARGRKPKVGPWRVRGWLRTSRVSSGGASVDADTFWPLRPAATEAAAGMHAKLAGGLLAPPRVCCRCAAEGACPAAHQHVQRLFEPSNARGSSTRRSPER